MARYYRIISTLKQPTGCNYVEKAKGPNNTEINKSIRFVINGAGRPGELVPDTFVNKRIYDLLVKEKGSVFNILQEQRLKEQEKGFLDKGGITVQECGFNDLPEADQKKYDLGYFTKLESQRKNAAAKAQEQLDAEKAAESGG